MTYDEPEEYTIYTPWEEISGVKPDPTIRTLAIAIHNAYMREMGAPHYCWGPSQPISFRDISLDQIERWDNIAKDILGQIPTCAVCGQIMTVKYGCDNPKHKYYKSR